MYLVRKRAKADEDSWEMGGKCYEHLPTVMEDDGVKELQDDLFGLPSTVEILEGETTSYAAMLFTCSMKEVEEWLALEADDMDKNKPVAEEVFRDITGRIVPVRDVMMKENNNYPMWPVMIDTETEDYFDFKLEPAEPRPYIEKEISGIYDEELPPLFEELVDFPYMELIPSIEELFDDI